MMDQALREFPNQFTYEPIVENADKLSAKTSFLSCGMGGSSHQAGLLQIVHPEIDLLVHRSYGLPTLPEHNIENRLVIAVSFSGNTEEPLDAYRVARERGISVAALAVGGKLIEMAKADGVPYVELPNIGLQPRSGLGYTLRGELALMGKTDILRTTDSLSMTLDSNTAEQRGAQLAEALRGRVPIIYTSTNNSYLAYVAKIKLNEGAKIPSYFHVFPELNHNEMQGFYVTPETKALSDKFYFLFLTDSNDDPRIQKRMAVTKKLYEERGLATEEIPLEGESRWQRLFGSLLVIDWAAYHLAKHYGFDPAKVEMVETFKQRIAS